MLVNNRIRYNRFCNREFVWDMTTRKERLEKAKKMLSWSDGSEDEDEVDDGEDDKVVESSPQIIEDVDEFFKRRKVPENRITPKYLKVMKILKLMSQERLI